MINKPEQKLVRYTQSKVQTWFSKHPAKAHGIDHARRVAMYARSIATSEGCSVFLSQLASLLHDIGYALMKNNPNKTHHELSYELCLRWFAEDSAYDFLSVKQKRIILYSIRYHWNDFANAHKEAVVLRDADKLDTFGNIGVKRTRMFHSSCASQELDVRLKYNNLYWIKTKEARRIIQKGKLMRPVDQFYRQLVLSRKDSPKK